MRLMKGRVFEKAGIHTSTVHGEFAPEFRKQIPGAEDDPRFWASGVSLIAHPHNPHVPAAHMNTRMVVTTQMVVRRRRRPDARARSPPHAGRTRTRSPSTLPCRPRANRHKRRRLRALQEMVRRVFLPAPPQGDRAAIGGIFYDYLTPSQAEGGWDAALRLHPGRRPRLPATSTRRSCAQLRAALDRGRARGAAGPPRPLRRVQPALRPRHRVRPQDRRQRRSDPVLDAARGEVALIREDDQGGFLTTVGMSVRARLRSAV